MKIICAAILFASVALTSAPAHGQIIGKVPPAAPKTPEYVPPAPPPPPPAPKPVEPEKPLPQLAIKEPDGKIRRYPEGAERAAIKAFEFDAQTRQKIADVEARRRADMERLVLEKLDAALEARKAMATIDQINNFNDFDRIKQVAAPLQVDKLTDRLMRDGAITPLQKSKIEQMVKEYETALGNEIRSETGADLPKIVGAVAKSSFTNSTRDSLEALDRLAACASGKFAQLSKECNLTGEQQSALGAAPTADALLSMLKPEQLKPVLAKCGPGAP